MLSELRVENLLLIERAELRLGPGLNAITGETGAGKTVLAHALDLLLGGRPRQGIVRPGAREAYVEGVLAVPPSLLDDPALADLRERLPAGDEELVLARRVGADGRTRAFVQGRSAPVGELRELGGRLIAFYGQHEHRRLTVASAQLGALDAFCGPEHGAAVTAFAACHQRVLELQRRVEEVHARAGARERDLDLLVFELEEIEALGPSEPEKAELLAERERLRHVEALRAAAGGAAEALAPEAGEATGAASLLAEADRLADGPAGVDGRLDVLAERLRALRIEADDVAAELRRYGAGVEAEPGRLEEVEARLALYDRLERKHGGSVAAVLEHAGRCRAERERLERAELDLEEAEAALAAAEWDRADRAAALSCTREAAAPRLGEGVLSELSELGMEGASFEVRLEPRDALGPSGAERAEFLIAPNAGVPPAPLRETASGGELSRIMLALMAVAAEGAGGPSVGARLRAPGPAARRAAQTLVFDEVDAGIGGQTARAVGERLRRLAAGRQVLCITHLPQIASLADSHFRIAKEAGSDLARTTVEQVEGDAVVEELCRMLGADTSDAGARRHAEELLAAA
jgi:DNA repair protein RecN (Recombination protein N)